MGIRSKPQINDEEYSAKLDRKSQTVDGQEIPDPTPMEPPIGYVKQPSMVEIVRDMVRSEALRREAEAAGAESFEEADDFDVPEELEPQSAYEFEPEFEPPIPASDATGVPSPSGEGKGQGGTGEAPEAPKPVEVAASPPPATPARGAP